MKKLKLVILLIVISPITTQTQEIIINKRISNNFLDNIEFLLIILIQLLFLALLLLALLSLCKKRNKNVVQ